MRAMTWLLSLFVTASFAADPADPALAKRVDKILRKTPLIDGHNDVPWQVRSRAGLDLAELPFGTSTSELDPPMHTDLPRMRKGSAGGQFWSVWIPTDLSEAAAVVTTLEQMDVVHRMVARWPDDLELARTADDIERIHRQGRIASLIGLEGGHSIGNSLGALRSLHAAGAAYMTLTHWRTLDWADAATDDPRHDGLSAFGEQVVREMNRLGMLVDLSHVSRDTMLDALAVTQAPVIFSHSGAFAINAHPRNVPDDVLDKVKANDGVVMVDFLPTYVSAQVRSFHAERAAAHARLEQLHLGDPVRYREAVEAWNDAHAAPRSTLAQVADHADHIRDRIGAAHIGIGSDFDGMGDQPDGLADVSQVPALLVELLRRGWTDAEVAGVAGANVLRAMRGAEAAASRLQATTEPSVMRITPLAPEAP